MNIRLSNGLDLPKEIVEGFINAENKKLCAVYLENEEKLGVRVLRTTKFDLELIQDLISANKWNDEINDFMIIDEKGNILFATDGAKFKTKIDENGYIYINEDKLVVHSHSDGFTYGNSKEAVDRNYRKIVETFYMDTDENFGENGFVTNNKPRRISEIIRDNNKSDPRD